MNKQTEALKDWEIDVSTGTKILTYKKCSVIEDEQAELMIALLNLVEDVVKPAYALLWGNVTDTKDIQRARHLLRDVLTKEQQKDAIADVWGREHHD